MQTTLEVLNHTGHMTMTWNHADESERENARKAVESLKEQGYTFFLVDGSQAVGSDDGKGHLIVKTLTSKEVMEPASDEPDTAKKTKGRRGRRVVATRPMAGG